jgi:hypothetical protein
MIFDGRLVIASIEVDSFGSSCIYTKIKIPEERSSGITLF